MFLLFLFIIITLKFQTETVKHSSLLSFSKLLFFHYAKETRLMKTPESKIFQLISKALVKMSFFTKFMRFRSVILNI